MLPLSHVYVSTKLTGRKSPLLVFGSVLPDIATISRQEISRDQIHYAPEKFFDFVKANFPDLIDLALGVRLHSNIGRGADYYSDDGDVGFAKIEGEKIVGEVKCLLSTDDQRVALGLAHNFVEAGVDLNLKDFYPEILTIYYDGLNGVDLMVVANCLSRYLGLNEDQILEELNYFCKILSPKHFSSVEQMVGGIVVPLIEIKLGKKVGSVLARQILLMAKKNVEDKYLGYLDEAVSQMRVDFVELLEF